MNKKEASEIVGGLTRTSKMPCPSLNLPAESCKKGSALVKIKGSVCEDCYALKGFYNFKKGKEARDIRLANIYNPKWVEAMVVLVKDQAFFRWHDSGDLQSLMHLNNIMEVARRTPDTKHWIPTREYHMIADFVKSGLEIPSNMYVRLSAIMVDGNLPTKLANTLNNYPNTKGFIGVSGVSKDKQIANCPAYNNGGKCGDCRICWTKKESVVYPLH